MLPEEQLMRGQPVLSADSEDLWDEQYQMEVSNACIALFDGEKYNVKTVFQVVGGLKFLDVCPK